jgi:hypothetical protein
MRREIHYRPPSGQCPKLRDVPVRDQWAWIERFFSRCTDARPFAMGATLSITLHELIRDRRLFQSAIKEAIRQFGDPKFESDVSDGYAGSWKWELGADESAAAVEFLARGEPWALPSMRPICITYLTTFNLRHPRTGLILRGQMRDSAESYGLKSSFIGFMGPHPWLQPHFVFPFPRVTDRFLNFLAAFSAELPYRLAPRHFRSIRPVSEHAREGIGFLSPEDDEKIRRAQMEATT